MNFQATKPLATKTLQLRKHKTVYLNLHIFVSCEVHFLNLFMNIIFLSFDRFGTQYLN